MKITATYSPEDNKLRLYVEDNERLDDELYQRVKDHGFRWAPMQKLFVAPSWSPSREDLCLDLAGSIEPESMTLVERAEIKAARLDQLIEKRAGEASSFSQAAQELSRSVSDQPILSGHHSQRKAEKLHDKVEATQTKAEKAADAVQYWSWKADGVERHANHKACDRTRGNRIEKLLADLRKDQRWLNHGKYLIKLWGKINNIQDQDKKDRVTLYYSGARGNDGKYSRESTYNDLDKGEISTQQAIDISLEFAHNIANSVRTRRYIVHTLNRLAYEQAELGGVSRFDGALTKTILQGFARTHGADKPEAKKVDGQWQVSSIVDLPAHIANSEEIALNDDAWRDLMQSSGYEVPAPKPRKPPILNFQCGAVISRPLYNNPPKILEQVSMTKGEYSKLGNGDAAWVMLSNCGQFRFKTHADPRGTGPSWNRKRVAIYLTDSKAHPAPESESILSAEQFNDCKEKEVA